MRGVRSSCCDEGRHRPRFGDALFKNLAIRSFTISDSHFGIDGFVKLPDMRIDFEGGKERIHTKGTAFVRDNGYNACTDIFIFKELA